MRLLTISFGLLVALWVGCGEYKSQTPVAQNNNAPAGSGAPVGTAPATDAQPAPDQTAAVAPPGETPATTQQPAPTTRSTTDTVKEKAAVGSGSKGRG